MLASSILISKSRLTNALSLSSFSTPHFFLPLYSTASVEAEKPSNEGLATTEVSQESPSDSKQPAETIAITNGNYCAK